MGKPHYFSRRSVLKILAGLYAGTLIPDKLAFGKIATKNQSDLPYNYVIRPSLPLISPAAPKLQVIGYGSLGLQVIRFLKEYCPYGLSFVHIDYPSVVSATSTKSLIKKVHMTFLAFDLEELKRLDQEIIIALFSKIRRQSSLSFGVTACPVHSRQIHKCISHVDRFANLSDTLLISQYECVLSASGRMRTLNYSTAQHLGISIQSLTSKMTHIGLVGLDFADYIALFKDSGVAFSTTGFGKGRNRCKDAVDCSLHHIHELKERRPTISFKSLFANIHSSGNITIDEITMIADNIRSIMPSTAELVFGQVMNEKLGNTIRVDCIPIGVN